MGGERMVVKRSIASLVRKKLSDITNTQTHPKLYGQAEKSSHTSPSDKNCVEQLLKEKATLVQLLAERDKIIELNGVELQRLRANVEKLQLQNWNLAQSNSQMLAELNLGRERMKALQHEVLCKDALLQGKNSDVGLADYRSYLQGVEDTGYENDGSLSKASNDEKHCDGNRKRTKRNRSIGSVTASTNESKRKEIRSQLRRESASFKAREQKPVKKNSRETEKAKTARTGANILNSPAKVDEASGKPLRKAAERVQPYKEIPPQAKQRRLE